MKLREIGTSLGATLVAMAGVGTVGVLSGFPGRVWFAASVTVGVVLPGLLWHYRTVIDEHPRRETTSREP